MIYIGSWSGALKFLKKNLYIIASKKNFFIFALLLVVVVVLFLMWYFSRFNEGYDATDASTTTPKFFQYLLCDNQQCDKDENFRVVSSFLTLSQFKSNVYSQNGPFFNGDGNYGGRTGQSYKIRGPTDLKYVNGTLTYSKDKVNDFDVLVQSVSGEKFVILEKDKDVIDKKIEAYFNNPATLYVKSIDKDQVTIDEAKKNEVTPHNEADDYDEDDQDYINTITEIINYNKPPEVDNLPKPSHLYYNDPPPKNQKKTNYFKWGKWSDESYTTFYKVLKVNKSTDTLGWYDCQISDKKGNAVDDVITVHPGRLYWVPRV